MGARGHPMFLSSENDVDNGFLTDNNEPTLPRNWAATERSRRATAQLKHEQGTQYDTVQPKSAGSTSTPSLKPSTRCVGSIAAYLLAHQSDATNQFRMITTGSRAAPNKQKSARTFTPAPLDLPQDEPAPSTPTHDEDVMFDGEVLIRLSAADTPEDVTMTPITESDTDAGCESATHTTFSNAIARCEGIDTVYWPLGFRINKQEYAQLGERLRTKPYSNNIAAWFTLHGLFPQRPASGPSIECAERFSLGVSGVKAKY
ncbi:hypothetical protein C8R46DRAFT_1038064 [Mycena filopes]|nr:hypothetical protein C8R46DRAFT_1038064 [Mycena filopes]